MLVIVGWIVVIASVLGGYTIAGGFIEALIHPSEVLTIGGAALGAAIVMAPGKVLKDLVKAILQCLKGSPFTKKAYEELFQALYELFRLARRDGVLVLESHLTKPHESSVFSKYPTIMKNHHVTSFISGALLPVIDGSVGPQQLPGLLETEFKAMEDEHHAPLSVLNKTADGLPGFGIVAAVLGIVITMGAIDGPVEEIGHKVGAALVGTFLGILASYGFIGPLVGRMESLGHQELAFFHTIEAVVLAFVKEVPPKVAIDQARRGVASDLRPTRAELDQMFKDAEAA